MSLTCSLGIDPANSQETGRHAFCKMPCEAPLLKTSLAAGGEKQVVPRLPKGKCPGHGPPKVSSTGPSQRGSAALRLPRARNWGSFDL